MGANRGRVAHPYGELIELAERQQQVVADRDYEALGEIVEIRDALIAELPANPPEGARLAIRHLIELEERIQVALAEASRGVAIELARLRTGRAGVRRYKPAPAAAKRRLDYSA
jgi:hypothetical protein